MSYKINVKIGAAEFFAEGEQKTVQEHFKLFLEALKNASTVTANKQEQKGTPMQSNEPPSSDDLDRIFSQDDQSVTLRFKPGPTYSEAQALLAILYGYKALKGIDQVLSIRLKGAAIRSGLSGQKASALLTAEEKKFVRTGGSRRAAFYTLSNLGMKKAEEIVKSMLAS